MSKASTEYGILKERRLHFRVTTRQSHLKRVDNPKQYFTKPSWSYGQSVRHEGVRFYRISASLNKYNLT